MNGRKNREDGLAAGEHLLMQHFVGLEHGHQAGRAEDRKDGIDVVELVFAIIDSNTQVFGGSGSQYINRIAHRSTRKEFAFQFFGRGAFEFRHIQSAFTQRIGQHHTGASGMGNDSKVLPFEFGERKDATHRG